MGRYPGSAPAWVARYSSQAPDAIWTMQGVGPGVDDGVGSNDLVAGGGVVTFGNAGEDGRLAIEFTSSVSYLEVADTSFGDVGPSPISAWGRFFIPNIAITTNASFMGKRATSGSLNRWYTPIRDELEPSEVLRHSVGLLVQDATNPSQSMRTQDPTLIPKPGWIDIIVVIDLANQFMALRNAPGIGERRAVDDTDPVDGFGGGNFAVGAHTAGVATTGSRCSYLATWTNYALTLDEQLEIIGIGDTTIGAPSGLAADIAGGFSIGLNPE